MALVRREIAATTKDLTVNQWLFTIVESMEQEKDRGRLVYIAQATGLRMTRGPDGQFVGLGGEVVTEADLAAGFLTPTNKVIRLALSVGFAGDDEPVVMSNLRDTLVAAKLTRAKSVLKFLEDLALAEKAEGLDDGVVDDGAESPLDRI